MKRIQRLALGSLFGGTLAALAFTPASAYAIECVETKSTVCCESSTGQVSCFALPSAT